MPPKRFQSQTERDVAGFAARQERDAAPEQVDEDVTGQYSGEVLRVMRARRGTHERIGRLEEKHDKLADEVGEIAKNSREMKGSLGMLVEMTGKAEAAREAREKREAEERASKRAGLPTLIKAIGYSVAIIIAAALGYGVGR